MNRIKILGRSRIIIPNSFVNCHAPEAEGRESSVFTFIQVMKTKIFFFGIIVIYHKLSLIKISHACYESTKQTNFDDVITYSE